MKGICGFSSGALLLAGALLLSACTSPATRVQAPAEVEQAPGTIQQQGTVAPPPGAVDQPSGRVDPRTELSRDIEDPLACAECGVIQDVREVQPETDGSGVGAVIGAIVGGVAGHQVGGGTGQDIATATGAIGGAVAGNEVEENLQARGETYYEVDVAMENGETRTIAVPDASGARLGAEVRVEGNTIFLE